MSLRTKTKKKTRRPWIATFPDLHRGRGCTRKRELNHLIYPTHFRDVPISIVGCTTKLFIHIRDFQGRNYWSVEKITYRAVYQ